MKINNNLGFRIYNEWDFQFFSFLLLNLRISLALVLPINTLGGLRFYFHYLTCCSSRPFLPLILAADESWYELVWAFERQLFRNHLIIFILAVVVRVRGDFTLRLNIKPYRWQKTFLLMPFFLFPLTGAPFLEFLALLASSSEYSCWCQKLPSWWWFSW